MSKSASGSGDVNEPRCCSVFREMLEIEVLERIACGGFMNFGGYGCLDMRT